MVDSAIVIFNQCLVRWKLAGNGEPIVSQISRLFPVMRGDGPTMLKPAIETEEKRDAMPTT